ncbi:MAG: hypothetical protein JEZ08_22685 [Clostridiales bacterium]|nr:hypothetical protein [Clostridiales bacterium]
MKKIKLDIGKGIADAVECIKSTYKPLLVLLLIMLAIQIVQGIYYQPLSTADLSLAFTDPEVYRTQVENMPGMTGFQTLMSFGLTLIVFMNMNVVISISNKFFNKNEMTIEDIIYYSLKKIFALIVSFLFMMLTFIPLIIVMVILVVLSIAAPPVMVILIIVFVIGLFAYINMCIMIQYSIVIEDVGPIRGWLNSIKLVSHNFFRVFFTYIGFMLVSFLLRSLFLSESIVTIIITGILSGIISMFLTITMTAVYNQAIEKEPETSDYRDA